MGLFLFKVVMRVNKEPHELEAGEYSKWDKTGFWYAVPPVPGTNLTANLSAHEVVEHEDGTITVSPSIEITMPDPDGGKPIEYWHGYLERGIWKEC